MLTVPKVSNFTDFIKYISLRNASNIKYDLDRINLILAKMGHPEMRLRGLHVAGTNGKGSTSAMLESICLSHNWNTGLNTSPHLVDYRERFRINGKNITARELMKIYNLWSNLFEETEASFFEITTAIAFYYFNAKNLHTSIFEVGLGGRLDATNPFNATVSIITSISIDHPKTLGDTIEKIAYEKAGIIKGNVPLVLGKLSNTAFDVISKVAYSKSAPLYYIESDFNTERVRFDQAVTTFDYINKNRDISLPKRIANIKTNLVGKHQAHNAALAITGYALYCNSLKIKPDPEAIRYGLRNVTWLGRMQTIRKQPLTILDCAHNEEGIENLVKNLQQIFPNKRFRLVIAILRDKSFEKMILHLGAIAKKLYISKNNSDRAADIEEQVEIAKKYGIEYSAESDINTSLNNATKESSDDDIIIVTGSIYTVSEIVAQLGKKRTWH
ncbi:MAG: bifunctional folylpolyglutamate synthase/dihydrofolate synthase [Candidatus Cloacimonetes bacterium]|nr:bifunctional folylpolyglutamate synthase/dihydrofolate synthase [Candidatus Cloacimonadota bacterium]